MKVNYFLSSLTALLLSASVCFAQKGIEALINAEKNFASFTSKNTIKEGFLKYIDQNGIIFSRGAAKNGTAHYQQAQPSKAILSWEPEWAVISASGDFGFTTGPYEYRMSLPTDTPFTGNYTSIWHLTASGEWKFLLDIGNPYPQNHQAVSKTASLDLGKMKLNRIELAEAEAEDKKLNGLIFSKGGIAFQPYLSNISWLNKADHLPLQGIKKIQPILSKIPTGQRMEFIGSGIASAKDMAYTYGNLLQDNNPAGNYMRVWIRKQNKWILLLQVMG